MPCERPMYTANSKARTIQNADQSSASRAEMGASCLWACRSIHRQMTTPIRKTIKCVMVYALNMRDSVFTTSYKD